jgi:hypothetical protein
MDKKLQVIEICKELRLPSIRQMIEDDTAFNQPEIAIDVLLQVLMQEKNDRLVRRSGSKLICEMAHFSLAKYSRYEFCHTCSF